MIPVGKTLRTDSGRKIRVDGPLMRKAYDPVLKKEVDVHAVGGEGSLYWATNMSTGEKLVLKVFHHRFTNEDTARRLRFIVDQKLSSVCPAICCPVDMVTKSDFMGHFSRVAPGVPLEEHLKNPSFNLMEGLQVSTALAHIIDVFHKRQIAHGDLHADNLIVNRSGSVLHLYVIDLDNFNAPGAPPPPMIGHNLYMAPEIRVALAKKQHVAPNLKTDLYSLGVQMHEIILLRHVATGSDKTKEEFEKAMLLGWIFDPARSDRPMGDLGGYRAEVLNPDLVRLFRSSLSPDPDERPSAEQWKIVLGQALNSVAFCPKCGGAYIVDVSKVKCPSCQCPFPPLTMVVRGTGGRYTLTHGATVIGRKELGGSMKVSSRHAIFRRIGPETWMESVGSNGTYRSNGSGWVRVPDKKPILVKSDDRLRLGDVEVDLKAAA